LTLRQFYLFLSEYYEQERAIDRRCYKLICTQLERPPAPGKLFPLLENMESEVDTDSEPDDLITFQQVTASLVPHE